MKKYVVRNKNTNAVFGKFDTQNEASKELIRYINARGGVDCVSVFDFDVKEEEVQEIDSYEKAIDFLGIKDIYRDGEIKTVETTPKHYKALSALSRLLVIAEAWNKEDGFMPDFSNEYQLKYFPWFVYDSEVAGYVFADTLWTASAAYGSVGSQLCFSTHERARSFGEKFQGLYNQFFNATSQSDKKGFR